MHPALIRFVEPPPRRTLRDLALGAIAGTIGLVAAVGLVSVAEHAYLDPPRAHHAHEPAGPVSPHDLRREAEQTVRRYAFEAYPSWAVGNPELDCPRALGELARYLERPLLDDPWGLPYQMFCEHNRVWVRSAGPDGAFHTDDDIRSDR